MFGRIKTAIVAAKLTLEHKRTGKTVVIINEFHGNPKLIAEMGMELVESRPEAIIIVNGKIIR